MPASPFASVANARLVFKVPTGTLTVDGNGNPVPTTSEIVVLALLLFGKPEIKHESGIDEVTVEVSGYVVDPIELPFSIDDLSEPAQVEIKKSKSQTLNAQFKLSPQAQNPFVLSAGVEGLFKISGVLSYRRN